MKTVASEVGSRLSHLYVTDWEADQHVWQYIIWPVLIYIHFGFALYGFMPLWTLCISTPILMARWVTMLHELMHMRGRKVNFLVRLVPILFTPFSVGYIELFELHQRHHRFAGTPDDADYYHIRGSIIAGFFNALTHHEQAFIRWVASKGMDATLFRYALIRFVLFVAFAWSAGWAFLWYFIPVRIAYGITFFWFSYGLHRRNGEYGTFAIRYGEFVERVLLLLVGRAALYTVCYHPLHHSHPRIPAIRLAEAIQQGACCTSIVKSAVT